MRYPQIASAFYNTPWFLTREKMAEIDMFVRQGLDGARVELSGERLESWRAAQSQAQSRAERTSSSIAVIPIRGVLMQRPDVFDELFGASSILRLTKTFRGALAEPEVKTILFDVDSPGGSVFGIEEFSAEIFAARGRKRMVAVSNSQMASAAYYLASAADEVVASPSSDSGSIGIISLHLDFSKATELEGVKPTWITYGQFKAEGNQLEPLGEEAQAFWQQRVDEYGEMFVKAVARNRGITPKEVRENYGQGRSFGAKEAKQRGMADRVASFDETLERLRTGGPSGSVRSVAMALERERVNIAAVAAGVRLPHVERELQRERLAIDRLS